MGISFTDIWNNITSAVNRATTWSEAKINAVITGIDTDLGYVTQFFVHQGPVLLADANTVLTDLEVVATAIPSVSGLGAAAGILKEAITVFNEIVTGITQATQQPSAAQSLTMHPDPLAALVAARIAQSNLDVAKAQAAALIAQHGGKK